MKWTSYNKLLYNTTQHGMTNEARLSEINPHMYLWSRFLMRVPRTHDVELDFYIQKVKLKPDLNQA